MKVSIKSFDVAMDVKNSGVELQISSSDGAKFLGDCIVTKTGLIWCKGKTKRANGIKISWQEFIDYMESPD